MYAPSMRAPLLALLLVACDPGGPPPETDLPAAAPAGAWALADGARLDLHEGRLALDGAGQIEPLASGPLVSAPLVSPDGARAAFVNLVGEGPKDALVVLWWEGGWRHRTVLKSAGIDRLALDEDGQRLAFVWSGPAGGVGALYTLDLTDPKARPQRRNHLDPQAPPSTWTPLPQPGSLRFDGAALVWQSEDGPHRLELAP